MTTVLLTAFCDKATVHYKGYSEKAARRKIQEGIWTEGKEYTRSPDGRIQIILEGYERWAGGHKRVG